VHCSVLQCVAVHCSVLQCVAVHCSVLQCVVVHCSVLQCVAVHCSVLQCVAVHCSVLQCVAVHCSVLQCVAVYRSQSQCVLLCAAVCCSALQCVAVRCSALQCVAVCCSVLQCVAVRYGDLQCVAVHWKHHSNGRHDSFTSATWLIHMCDMTHSHVWHDWYPAQIELLVLNRSTESWDESHTYEWVMTPIWIGQVAHMIIFETFLMCWNSANGLVLNRSTSYMFNLCLSSLQHTVTHCNTLQHTATHCNTLYPTLTTQTFTCATWLIHMGVMPRFSWDLWLVLCCYVVSIVNPIGRIPVH